jgi:HTH-type transcriptional regulator/antitoxin HigA
MNQGQIQNTEPMKYGDIPKTYNRLLALYPLRPIHSNAELEHATTIIDRMAGHDLNADQADYLDALSTLVEAYENAHYPHDAPTISGLDALRALLDDHGMGVADFARLLGVHRSMGSKLLEGERLLTTRHLKILSDRFKVSADLFLGRQRDDGA